MFDICGEIDVRREKQISHKISRDAKSALRYGRNGNVLPTEFEG
jgi:hypothetical protein